MTMPGFQPKQHCRMCASTHLAEVLDLGPVPVGDRYVLEHERQESTPHFPLALHHCRSCGHLQLSGQVDPELLYGHYLYETGSSPGLDQHFAAYARAVQERCHLSPGAWVVDVGSNTGVLLRHFQALGLVALGIEPATVAAQTANAAGVSTLNAYFTQALAENLVAERGRADVITANNVLANIDDLDGVFAAMRVLLADEGVIVVESGYAVDTVGQFVIDNLYHEHISYFAVAPLQRFLRERGLRIFHADRVATKGGSLRVFICREASRRVEQAEVGSLAQLEAELGFLDGSAAEAFAARANTLKPLIRSHLEALGPAGTLVGYGASVGVTTLLHWLEIGQSFGQLIDDNPIKQGRFSPGFHLPVSPSPWLLASRPACVVNLAWRYRDLIHNKNQEYLRQGGCFQEILPWPGVFRGAPRP